MRKFVFVLIAVVAVAFVAGLLLSIPRLRSWRLETALAEAGDAEAAASIARTIMKSDDERGKAVLVQYANERDLCAFDTTHNLLVLCDAGGSKIHIVYVGPRGSPVSTGDAALDRAVTAAIPEPSSETLSMGDPPVLFNGVHLLAAEPAQADFILREQAGSEWHRLCLKFTRGRLMSQGVHSVSDAELQEWRKNPDWPPSWS
jgi:hypothetical protein